MIAGATLAVAYEELCEEEPVIPFIGVQGLIFARQIDALLIQRSRRRLPSRARKSANWPRNEG